MRKYSLFAQNFLQHVWGTQLLRPGERVAVAVSGGADSVALLRLLMEVRDELGIVLSVAHLEHGLRGAQSKKDAQFVEALAKKFGLELRARSVTAKRFANEHKRGLEETGRQLRYEFFADLCGSAVDKVATAHTQDDQAETVLMRLLRGAGGAGLAAILPVIVFGARAGEVVRPLLPFRRAELRKYLKSLRQSWREDPTNRDVRHTRNRIRHKLLPLLEREFNPQIVRVLAETAEIMRGEEEHWRKTLAAMMPRLGEEGALLAQRVAELEIAIQRRVLVAAAQSAGLTLDFEHIEAIRELVGKRVPQGAPRVKLPGGGARLESGAATKLILVKGHKVERSNGFCQELAIPGEACIPAVALHVRARIGEAREDRNVCALIPTATKLTLRNWRAGDRYWPAGRSAPKKVKELLQKIPAVQRKLWPVIEADGEIIWMRGFPAPTHLKATQGEPQALLIEEVPAADDAAQNPAMQGTIRGKDLP